MVLGKFITFEGGDGSGKTTQSRKLGESLEKRGYSIFHSREPGGTPISEQARSMVLGPSYDNMCEEAELMLFMTARAQHTYELIIPKLKEVDFFICDRYELSSVAYQGYGRGFLHTVKVCNRFVTRGLVPDLTFVIDIPAKKGLEKLTLGEFSEDGDRMEKEMLSFHEKVCAEFLKEAQLAPERIKVIPYIENKPEEMHEKILAYVLDLVKS